jgi:apolipoprotein N-acyltransferase
MSVPARAYGRNRSAVAPARAPLRRIRAALAGFSGWRRALAAILLGLAATAALPPVFALPLLVVAFTGLLWLIEGATSLRQAATLGWWFGLGHFTSGIYWVALALLTDPERYGLMAPFAPLGLGAFLAIYPAGAAALAKFAERVPLAAGGAGRVIALAIAWSVAEWLRGHLLTGFPWNLVASAWNISDAMMQVASLCGAYGLGFVTVIAAAMPAVLGEERVSAKRAWLPVAAAYLLLAVIWAGGTARLAAAGSVAAQLMVPDTMLRIVQPDVAQTEKWRDELRIAHLKRDLELTDQAAIGASRSDDAVFVIWPETAVPFLVDQDATVREAIASVVPPRGLVITGAPRATPPDVEPFEVWNGVVAVNAKGAVIGHYDKFHLVPFGEYLPLRSVIPSWLGLAKLTPGATDFSAGPGPRTLHLPGLPPVGPLICYEIIFPDAVADRDDRPGLFVNVTNDAWFGTSSGPYQHFESARMRAVEEGIPVARAANTGISGVIDAYGRVVARLGLNQEGSFDSPLPRALAEPPLYARFGDLTLLPLMLAAVGFAAAARRPR